MSENIKVVSFNVEYCASINKGYWQYLTKLWKYVLPHDTGAIWKISDFIKRDRIDIATFMEVDGGSYRTRKKDYMKILSKLTQLRYNIFFPVRHIWFGLTNQGNGIATRYEILETRNVKLETNRVFGENRYLSISKLDVNGKTLYVFTTQLALGRRSRVRELKHIAREINRIDGPIIFTGDLNTQREKELEILNNTKLTRVESMKTFPSWKPRRRIDYIFYSPEFELMDDYVVEDLKASDHLPVVAELRWK
jgi:endonuclease/exonuclease/phosphatase family metal-dependent hydrolase